MGRSRASWTVAVVGALTLALGACAPAGQTQRLSDDSLSDDSIGDISGDGRFVVYNAYIQGQTRVYLKDRQSGATSLVVNGGNSATVSDDGRYVAYVAYAAGTDSIFRKDRQTGVVEQVDKPTVFQASQMPSRYPHISANGWLVAFTSAKTNLVPNDTNQVDDAFVRDLFSARTERVSVSSSGTQSVPVRCEGSYEECFRGADAYLGGFSPDGRHVLFSTASTGLVAGDGDVSMSTYLRDRTTATTELVGVDDAEQHSYRSTFGQDVSGDGRYVVFTDDQGRVLLRDRTAGTTRRVDLSSDEVPGNAPAGRADISDDGRYVAFASEAANLVSGDTNGLSDVFVRDLVNATTTRASVGSNGAQGDGPSLGPALDDSGDVVVFASDADNFSPEGSSDVNFDSDIFARIPAWR